MKKAVILVCLCPLLSWGANHYIRQGALGNNDGSDWTHAWTQLPTAFTRGDTYYVADGPSYVGRTLDTAESGTDVITIKKATIADHGTEDGWNDYFGDGQAVFVGDITFTTSYWEFNGATRNSNNWAQISSYGFRIASANWNGPKMFINDAASCITNKFVDIGAPAGTTLYDCVEYCIDATDGARSYDSPYCRSNLYVGYCHLHNTIGQWQGRGANNVLMEFNHFGHDYNKNTIRHWEGINWVIRWNRFIDTGDQPNTSGPTGCICAFSDYDHEEIHTDGWEIYGNVIASTHHEPTVGQNYPILIEGNDTKVYHNVFAHRGGYYAGMIRFRKRANEQPTGCVIKNNLWYWMGDYSDVPAQGGSQIGVDSAFATVDRSWCYYKNSNPANSGGDCSALSGVVFVGTEDPFVDEPNGDYRLKASFSGVSPIDKAENLGAPYNVDAYGTTHYNIGAFAVTNVVEPPSPPVILYPIGDSTVANIETLEVQ